MGKKVKLYHGTSSENYMNMISGDDSRKRNWVESDLGELYFERTDCVTNSALKCAAIHNSQANHVVVIKIEVDEDLIYPDTSTPDNPFNDAVCLKYSDAMRIIRKRHEVSFRPYHPEHRAKYLYNTYHNCCATCWDDIKDYVVDREIIEKECDKLYEDLGEYEWHFWDEIGYDDNIPFRKTVLSTNYLFAIMR